MRTISLIIIHCSATPEGRHYTPRDIDLWHRQRGFRNGIGYHYVITLDGTIYPCRPEEMTGAHCLHHNTHSIGICYIGGLTTLHYTGTDGRTHTTHVPADTRTPAQRTALTTLLTTLHRRYPHALILGHHDLDPTKQCPCFDAISEYTHITHGSTTPSLHANTM